MTDYEKGRLYAQAQHVAMPGTFRNRRRIPRFDEEYIPQMNEVQTCLNCQMAKCVNCLSKKRKTVAAAQKAESIRRCLEQNLTVTETCRRVGIPRRTFYRIAREINFSKA